MKITSLHSNLTKIATFMMASITILFASSYVGAQTMDTIQGTVSGTGGTATGTVTVQIMTHLCNSTIKNADDFEKMENGKSAVAALVTDVLACPTTGLLNDAAATGTVAAPRTNYNFTIMNNSQTKMLSSSMFMQHKVCESQVNMDANMDGQIASSTCLDISHYDIPLTRNASDTIIHVTESMAPAGYSFGVLRFTPVAVDGNNDSESLKHIDLATGHIHLNTVTDKDGMIMLHVYQFLNSGATTTPPNPGGGTPTTTGTSTNGGNGNTESVQARIRAIQAEIALIRERILNMIR